MGLSEFLIALAIAAGAFVLVFLLPLVHPVVTLVVVACVFVWANPFFTIIEYWLTETALEVTAFRAIRLGRVPYAEIVEVRRARWAELIKPDLRWAESLGSNIFRPLVLIRRKTGRRKAVIITPADTGGFVAALRARMTPRGVPSSPAAGGVA